MLLLDLAVFKGFFMSLVVLMVFDGFQNHTGTRMVGDVLLGTYLLEKEDQWFWSYRISTKSRNNKIFSQKHYENHDQNHSKQVFLH